MHMIMVQHMARKALSLEQFPTEFTMRGARCEQHIRKRHDRHIKERQASFRPREDWKDDRPSPPRILALLRRERLSRDGSCAPRPAVDDVRLARERLTLKEQVEIGAFVRLAGEVEDPRREGRRLAVVGLAWWRGGIVHGLGHSWTVWV
jgi:hypothetical protein